MKKLILIIVIFNIVKCSNIEGLGAEYYYLSSVDASEIGYPYGSIIYKSNQKKSFKNILIYSDIEKINYNEKYILALQHPNKSFLKKRIQDDLKFWNQYFVNNKKDSLISVIGKKILLSDVHNLVENKIKHIKKRPVYNIINDDLKHNIIFKNKYNYYIIQKENGIIFGPLNLNEFENLKIKKKIDLDL